MPIVVPTQNEVESIFVPNTLANLIQDVYSLTKRDDLEIETLTAIKAATLKAHHTGFFAKDLFETGIVFTDAAYTQALEYKELLPRWRALSYLRKAEASGEPGKFFSVITPTDLFDAYGVTKTDVMYLSGSVFQIKSSTELKYALLGCYLNPDVTAGSYSSWIAQDHPFAIVFEAARVIFKTIGYDEQAASYEKFVQEQYAQILAEHVPVGY
jgi:hypothetical protein